MGSEQSRPPPVNDDVPAAPFTVPHPHPGIPIFTGARGMTTSDGEFEVARDIRTVYADGTQDIEQPFFGGLFAGARGMTISDGEFEVAREIRTVYADGTQDIERPFFGFPAEMFRDAVGIRILGGRFAVTGSIVTYEGPPAAPAPEGANASNYSMPSPGPLVDGDIHRSFLPAASPSPQPSAEADDLYAQPQGSSSGCLCCSPAAPSWNGRPEGTPASRPGARSGRSGQQAWCSDSSSSESSSSDTVSILSDGDSGSDV